MDKVITDIVRVCNFFSREKSHKYSSRIYVCVCNWCRGAVVGNCQHLWDDASVVFLFKAIESPGQRSQFSLERTMQLGWMERNGSDFGS